MNWKSHLVTFVLVFLVVVLFAQTCRPRTRAGAVPPPDARFVTLTLEGRPERLTELSYEVRAEVADTQAKRQQGLSGRAGLEPGAGMLYVYEQPQRPEFSEAATRFGLSVAFLRDDGTVAEVRENLPRQTRAAHAGLYDGGDHGAAPAVTASRSASTTRSTSASAMAGNIGSERTSSYAASATGHWPGPVPSRSR